MRRSRKVEYTQNVRSLRVQFAHSRSIKHVSCSLKTLKIFFERIAEERTMTVISFLSREMKKSVTSNQNAGTEAKGKRDYEP